MARTDVRAPLDSCCWRARLDVLPHVHTSWLGERQSPIPAHLLGSIPGPLAENPESKLQWWGVAAGACAIGP